MNEYETEIIGIVECNSTAIEADFVNVLAGLFRLRLFFAVLLVLIAVSIGKNAQIMRIIILVFLAFAGANMAYELGIKPHINMAKSLSSWAASSSLVSNTPVINTAPPTGNWADIANPPLGNGSSSLLILPPPPPLVPNATVIPSPTSSC